ncbi:hypothetical protein [Mycobacterium scrofulaceum]|uniref:Uncharacterized protein n=1 Tax=Mycobacterium scrofulaceum TaxID=1783 RepID=A0A1X0K590_MYCSC|nr:hypothetical protein [Mycobacterium scrofulaceum]ORB70308.1 hypothetical protein BST44_23905 [Mycobacterium scrofulaceum]
MAALPDRGSRDDLPITPADAARRWLFMHLDSGYTGGRRFSADAEKRWTAYRQEQASTPEQRTPIVSAPFDHPLDIRTDELISEFISAMDSAGIAEQPHIFGTFPTDGGDWLQPMHDVTAEGWYVPTTFGPAPGYVITRTATMYPLSQPRELAQTAVAREPELALPSVSKNPGLAEWTLFLHNCIQEADRDIIDRALCAENIDDRAGIMTVEFISQMRAREIAPTRQLSYTSARSCWTGACARPTWKQKQSAEWRLMAGYWNRRVMQSFSTTPTSRCTALAAPT